MTSCDPQVLRTNHQGPAVVSQQRQVQCQTLQVISEPISSLLSEIKSHTPEPIQANLPCKILPQYITFPNY